MLLATSSVRELIKQVTPDAQLNVDGKSIPIHRHYMSLISPVFAAMFKEGTMEAQTGKVRVRGFTYDVVKLAVDFCYGKDLPATSASKITDIYRFFDKYDIEPLRKKFDAYFQKAVTTESFFAFVAHAWKKGDEELMMKCARFLNHNTQLTLHPDFNNLEQPLMKHVLSLAAKRGNYNGMAHGVKYVHRGVICNICRVNPIVGIRYKCFECDNYDLCENCEKKRIHPNHRLIRIE